MELLWQICDFIHLFVYFYLHNNDPKSLFLHLMRFKHESIFFAVLVIVCFFSW